MSCNGISAEKFLNTLQILGINFYAGVPDSLLKEFNKCIEDKLSPENHIVTANEGAAVGLAIGHYLASGVPALVYLQNSGLGNAVNPLVSMADPAVMGCPMLLLIGWRGEIMSDGSQIKDEPQHQKQGQVTLDLLNTLAIPYKVMNRDTNLNDFLPGLFELSIARQGPVAIVVRKDTFVANTSNPRVHAESNLISREAAIEAVLDAIPDSMAIVSTTGMASRELHELRKNYRSINHSQDLLCVGAMGYASSIAAGIALVNPQKKLICLDGDGSMLMQLGAVTNASMCNNIIHIVLNNGAHDSVGGAPTRAAELSLADIAKACGYKNVFKADSRMKVSQHLNSILNKPQSSFLEIVCLKGGRKNLGRPTFSPRQNKENFMDFLKSTNE
jgi:phosphonopyruvate decarboxylase